MGEIERRDPATKGLDRLGTADLVALLVERHADVPAVVAAAASALAAAADTIVGRLQAGGRLTYAGSGTSGWLVAADAAEIPPTFGWSAERIAVIRARPAAEALGRPDEDSPERGAEAVERAGVGVADALVAVAASGATPFTFGAAAAARAAGAYTLAVVNVPDSRLEEACDHALVLRTGAEPILGSTRMRAGLAQKLALTVLSTAVMIGLGRTHDNLMVEVAPALAKLRERRLRMLVEATGLEPADAERLLDELGDDLKLAIARHAGEA